MAETTENYGLVKPEEHEYYSVGIQNENMEKIDAALTNKGNGAVWYATEVVQYEKYPHRIDVTIPNFVFTEGCIVVMKLPELDKSNISTSANWTLAIMSAGAGGYRLMSGGNTLSNTIPRDLLYGNQIITVTLSRSIADPLGGSVGTAFLSTFPANREFYSLEQLGFTPSDFSSDNADTAIEKLIDSMPPMATLRVNLPQTNTLAEVFRSRVLRDIGADWPWGSVLEIKKTIDKWQPNKITLLRNMGSGSETQEVYTYYDNTLGTFKPANFGSNKNLLHNWDFRNPVNQRGVNQVTFGPGEDYNVDTSTRYPTKYFIDRWNIECAQNAEFTVRCHEEGIMFDVVAIDGYINLMQRGDPEPPLIQGEARQNSICVSFEVSANTPEFRIGYISNHGFRCTGDRVVPPVGTIRSINGTVTEIDSSTKQPFTRTFAQMKKPGLYTFRRAKLELGAVSTLLNDPTADYGEQLALCQRYQFSVGHVASDNWYRVRATFITPNLLDFYAPLPVTMRSKPTLMPVWTIKTLDGHFQTGFVHQSTYFIDGGITVRFSKTAHGLADAVCEFNANSVNRIIFDANL